MAVGSRALSSLFTIVLCWGIASCAPASAKPADKPPAVPVELLASVSFGPASTLRGLQAYLEAFKPGIGTAITDQVIRTELAKELHVKSLDGVDPASWIYVLVSDSAGEPTITVLAKVSDQKRLLAATGADHLSVDHGWALIGGKPQIDRLNAYAFGVIATQPTPKAPSATVYVPQLLTRYQPQLAAVKTQILTSLASTANATSSSMTRLVTSYIEGLAAVSDDTLQLVVTFDATAALASLDFALVPRDKSRLAEFNAAQKPTDFALLDKLPQTTPSMLFGGRLDFSVYHEGFMSLLAAFFDPSGNRQLSDAFEAMRKAMTGELAMAFQLVPGAGTQIVELAGINDAKLASQGVDHILELFKPGRSMNIEGVVATIKTSPQTTTYSGVTLHGYDTTYDLSKANEAQRAMHKKLMPQDVQHTQVAIYDALTLVAVSQDSVGDAKKVIDASRGKPGVARFTPSPMIRDQLAAARARKDSMVMFIDLNSLMAQFVGHGGASPPLTMAFGTADHNAHFRVTLPAETLHTLSGAP